MPDPAPEPWRVVPPEGEVEPLRQTLLRGARRSAVLCVFAASITALLAMDGVASPRAVAPILTAALALIPLALVARAGARRPLCILGEHLALGSLGVVAALGVWAQLAQLEALAHGVGPGIAWQAAWEALPALAFPDHAPELALLVGLGAGAAVASAVLAGPERGHGCWLLAVPAPGLLLTLALGHGDATLFAFGASFTFAVPFGVLMGIADVLPIGDSLER